MLGRIQKHRLSRPASWRTLEQPLHLGKSLESVSPFPKVVLLDCLTLLVSNVLCSFEWEPSTSTKLSPSQFDLIQQMVDHEIDAILRFVQEHPVHLIIVSGEVGLGLVPDNALGRAFRDLLGWTNQRIARQATAIYFMLAGLPIELHSIASSIQDAAAGLSSRLQRAD
jgi:adenosylcobinamide kinase/adenosylcobinamide-phosphate guanylyltransferase